MKVFIHKKRIEEKIKHRKGNQKKNPLCLMLPESIQDKNGKNEFFF